MPTFLLRTSKWFRSFASGPVLELSSPSLDYRAKLKSKSMLARSFAFSAQSDQSLMREHDKLK